VTLIVGILCSDGIVVAADQQATHGAMGVPTVGQAVTKVQLFGGDILFAASGHAGLGQQLGSVIERRRGDFKKSPYAALIREVQTDFRALVDPAYRTAQAAAPIIGPQAAASDVVCHSVLATTFKDGFHLVEITPMCTVESIRGGTPFICLGSGKNSADPFLGFLRKVYWPEKLPTLRDGALAAYWTVRHVIDMHVQGVGFAVDVFLVETADGKPRARQLDQAELVEHQSFIAAAEDAMRGVRNGMIAPAADVEAGPPSEVPPPPAPPR
jgi:hypothetical protein